MSIFTSNKERRLWLWMLTVLVAIYTTLGLTRTVVDTLRERNLLQVSFAVVVFLIVAAFIWQWVKERPGWSETGVALGVALAYWMTFLRISNPAERTHLIEYGVVAALLHQALLERVRNGRYVPYPAALTVAATALFGLIDEIIQAVLPSRFFDWNDVFFNAFAGF
ncbi:MAG: VanZ family protein, partial [Chloroflexi bacterium]|nr:VanZ family protein [Chloroflexota bacterium]